jgi:hypothetical protein
MSRFWRVEYDVLSTPERVFRTIWELESEVNNGGFDQYFFNTSGRLVPNIVAALHAIGASAMAQIVQHAIEAVGQDVQWQDDPARREYMNKLSPQATNTLSDLDQAFYRYPDDLTMLLYRYVSEHRAEIGVPKEF